LTQAFTQWSGFSGFGYGVRSSIWYLLDTNIPTPGSYTLRITTSGTAAGLQASAILLRATKQEAPYSTAGTGTTVAANTISTNIGTSPHNEALLVDIDAAGAADITGTPGSGQTGVHELFNTYLNHFVSYKKAVLAGTHSMSWTFTGNANVQAHSIAAFAVAPITAIDHYSTWFGGGLP